MYQLSVIPDMTYDIDIEISNEIKKKKNLRGMNCKRTILLTMMNLILLLFFDINYNLD